MKYIILFGICLYTSLASASMHIEPYLGGGFAYSKVGIADELRAHKQLSPGFVLGSKFGIKLLSFIAGLDLFYNYYNTGNSIRMPSVVVHNPSTSVGFSQSSDSVSIQYSSSHNAFQPISIGVFGAIDIPLIVDVYSSVFYSFGKRASSFYHGPGLKAGISYLSAFFAQLNLELQWSHYFCNSTKCLQSKGIDVLSAMLTISVPFSTKWFGFMKKDYSGSSSIESPSIQSSDVIENVSTITNEL